MRNYPILALALFAIACGSNGSSNDAGVDSGLPPGQTDAGGNGGGTDAGTDAGMDEDAGTDAGMEEDAGMSSGTPCVFNSECPANERCECVDFDCTCQIGVRGTGQAGVDPCVDGNDCASSLCAEGNGGAFFCSGECTTNADCGPNLPNCTNIAFLGQICIRDANP